MPPVSRIAPLSCWRTLPADQFSNTRTVAIRKSLAAIHLLDEPCWRAALAGDDAAAVGVAVKLMPVERITCRTDMVMSALCLSALHGSAAACLVLGHILKQVGAIEPAAKRCAASWFGRQFASLGNEAKSYRATSLGQFARGRPSSGRDHHDHHAGTDGSRS
jgi:hypothetical protein